MATARATEHANKDVTAMPSPLFDGGATLQHVLELSPGGTKTSVFLVTIRPGHARIWPNRIWPELVFLVLAKIVCVLGVFQLLCVVCVVCSRFLVGVFKIFPRTAPSPGPPFPWTPKISLFFFSLHRKFQSFFSLWGVFSLNFGGVFESRCAQMCTFGVLWLSCEAPAALFFFLPRFSSVLFVEGRF